MACLSSACAPKTLTTTQVVLHSGGAAAAVGKTAVVTGGSRGLGRATVQGLILAGCRDILIIGRGEQQVLQSIKKIKDHHKKLADTKVPRELSIAAVAADLSSSASVYRAAKDIKRWLADRNMNLNVDTVEHFGSNQSAKRERDTASPPHRTWLDILVLNAGVMYRKGLSASDGTDLTFSTNVRGHFLLVHLLLRDMRSSPIQPSRIIWVSSRLHRRAKQIDIGSACSAGANERSRSTRKHGLYVQSKLANVLLAKELAKRLRAAGRFILVHSCAPGTSTTKLFRRNKLAKIAVAISGGKPEEGAATQTLLAIAGPDVKNACNGSYWENCKPTEPADVAQDCALGAQLYEALAQSCAHFISSSQLLPPGNEHQSEQGQTYHNYSIQPPCPRSRENADDPRESNSIPASDEISRATNSSSSESEYWSCDACDDVDFTDAVGGVTEALPGRAKTNTLQEHSTRHSITSQPRVLRRSK